ncbi:flavodoxin-dependent (E)-4-hydroxy-3-methylbut-2-enyl-diphosphate synthase [Hippea maritima]|uniref:4-hydroxy-3-methylbut-2-en-1-yl diphosphate synthase (flavodoxin) n=1 Tax=Hippea maritima (strain ATCC 700847 / DSM 10411 / MH2) TaxID=760142 RepID=F2LTT4_HIPMA|nr:flavodoxin-dependent (E)-4-hydroxy-3-methylbut-2-enyl-diphosphate synthase [Hippea maritima]AEA34460.1 4-hydroxy-3-methylbut-2-en-1-yl diphosphate synthase [Hippea maritima DSM 10411]
MSLIKRKKTKQIDVGGVKIGGGAPVVVQSMTNTDTHDVDATLKQIERLHKRGCEIVRCAVVDEDAALALRKIKQKSPIPVIADIHFNYKLALLSIQSGVDGLRINPGNIGSFDKVKEILKAAGERGIPIRIGVNSGSLEKDLLNKYNGPTDDALVESAYRWVRRIEDSNFTNMKVSIKSSDPLSTIICNEKISELIDYPLHIGVTEAGSSREGIVKSVSALSVLLRQGIGDTIRISLSEPPENEIDVCYELLNALHLRKKRSIDFVSCPTCGRIEIDLLSLVDELKKRLSDIDKPIKVAVMGCVVNALGEAKEADLAIAGGRHFGLIIKKGKLLKKVREDKLLDEFVEVVREYAKTH